MPSTYTPIATTTLGSAVNSYTFSSIPSTYTDLVIVLQIKGSATTAITCQFNGDTAGNYSYTILRGDGSSASSTRATSASQALLTNLASPTSTNFSAILVNVANYSNATTYKTLISRANEAASGVDAIVSLWRSTAAINSIKLMADGGINMAIGSTLTLYGIAAA